MDSATLTKYAKQMLDGELTVRAFVERLARQSTAEIDGASLDLQRQERCGFPEVVYGEGKSVETLEKIFATLINAGIDVFATRIAPEKAAALASRFDHFDYNETASTVRVRQPNEAGKTKIGRVAIVTAGTSDLRVAEEARETIDWMNVACELIVDVGVAGPQRLLSKVAQLREADAVVVVAGMEGALPSVVGGHVAVPVIAVPTSIGYGASLGGLAALLTMLNSCAANVTVVNIDAGFKAGYVAGLIARRSRRAQES
jgi:NCAIR mutase (PurE)-related protein